MPAYQVYLFGAPRLEYQNKPIAIDTRKALALLAFLLLNEEPQSRDTIAALLWPESSQTAARAALRRTLSTLRNALMEQLVDFGREILIIRPGDSLWCDVIAFQALLAECRTHGHTEEQVCERCLNPLQKAAEIYKGDFMSGFSLRDSAAFDDWQFFVADQFRRDLASVLERLVVIYGAQEDFPTAIEYARRWLNLDMLNESAHRALILLYAQSGQRNAALRQYRECVRILDQELGVPPLDETTQLYEAVKENRFEGLVLDSYLPGNGSQPAHAPDQPHLAREQHSQMPEHYPLVGRTHEWEELTRLYGSIGQDGVFAALTGEIGIGKSRLAHDFIAHQQERGVIALSTRCYAGESNLAYSTLIDLLRQGINQSAVPDWWQGLNPHWLSEISLLIPEFSELLPDLPAPLPPGGFGAQIRFYEAMCQILTTLVKGSLPGIIFIDNLEWVDQSTLDLLVYLARRLKGRPILLFVSWETEISPTTAILDQILNEAVWQGYGIHLPITALQPDQVQELIDQIAKDDQHISPAFRNRLAEVSEGLPYMLVEYLQAALIGEISTDLVPGNHLPLPTGLRGLLQNRLGNLSGPAEQILQTAAVIGRTFNFELLQMASGRAEEETIQGIEDLLSRNLILEVLDQTRINTTTTCYDFKHEQIRDLVLEKISLVRRRLLHRRIAETLEEQERLSSLRSQSGQIAFHYQQAGDVEKAAHYYFQAGMQDRTMHANADALNHYQSALALGYKQKLDVLMELGDLYTLMGDYPQAIQNYEAAAAYDVPGVLPAIEQKIGQVYFRRGQWEQAVCHFEAALFDLSALPAEEQKAFEARLRADLSLAFYRQGEIERANSFAQESLSLAEAEGDQKSLAQAQNLLGILARSEGHAEQALHHLTQSLSFAEQLNNPDGEIAALNNLALAQADLGEYPAALKTIRLAIEKTVLLGDRHLEAALRSNFADILRITGDSETAFEQLKEAAAIFTEIDQSAENWEPEIWKLVEW